MPMLDFPKRIWRLTSEIWQRKWSRRILFTLAAGLLLAAGGFLYAVFLEPTDLGFLPKIGIFLSVVGAALSAFLVVLERLFQLELTEKRLQVSERRLQEGDPNTLSEQVVERVSLLLRGERALPDSIYEARTQHYRREKLSLAKRFLDLLGQRIEFLKPRVPGGIRVIVDAGTTLAPIFDTLGYQSSTRPDHWSQGVKFITNNIRGIHLSLKYRKHRDRPQDGTASPSDRHRDIPIDCSVLPGKVLAAYQAIADERTLEALRDGPPKEVHTICVTTGNYILLNRRTGEHLPIARTMYHPHVKAALFHAADEVFNLAPLGKILVTERDEDLEDLLRHFNDDLELTPGTADPEAEAYQLVTSALLAPYGFGTSQGRDEWMKRSVLVTTTRDKEPYLFYPHSLAVSGSLRGFEPTIGVHLDGPRVWTCSFDELPWFREEQVKIEIPHENLREHKKRYFQINI